MPLTTATIWFDMDGVLSIYDHSDYIASNPNYKQPHYFATRPVNTIMKQLFVKLAENQYMDLTKLGIISKVQPEIPKFIEEASDKYEWVQKHIFSYIKKPYNMPYPPLFTGHNESKAKKIMSHLGRPLTQYDILIDDYNSNLEDWVAHGGTAIKYGLGDKESWKSYSFTDETTVDEMLRFLHIITEF